MGHDFPGTRHRTNRAFERGAEDHVGHPVALAVRHPGSITIIPGSSVYSGMVTRTVFDAERSRAPLGTQTWGPAMATECFTGSSLGVVGVGGNLVAWALTKLGSLDFSAPVHLVYVVLHSTRSFAAGEYRAMLYAPASLQIDPTSWGIVSDILKIVAGVLGGGFAVKLIEGAFRRVSERDQLAIGLRQSILQRLETVEKQYQIICDENDVLKDEMVACKTQIGALTSENRWLRERWHTYTEWAQKQPDHPKIPSWLFAKVPGPTEADFPPPRRRREEPGS